MAGCGLLCLCLCDLSWVWFGFGLRVCRGGEAAMAAAVRDGAAVAGYMAEDDPDGAASEDGDMDVEVGGEESQARDGDRRDGGDGDDEYALVGNAFLAAGGGCLGGFRAANLSRRRVTVLAWFSFDLSEGSIPSFFFIFFNLRDWVTFGG